jgi:pimeloyl-ACP methyl ester carboxylesterase
VASAELEVIHAGGTTATRPLLLVHGAWHAAWCWEPTFMPFFANRGWAVTALSLSGHGNSPGRNKLRWLRINQYVDDVVQVARKLPAPPVLVGHSMGGLVVQHYLARNEPARAAVLLASVPPTVGAIPAAVRAARRHPVAFLQCNLQLRLYPLVSTPERAHDMLFSPATPAETVRQFWPRLQDESFLAFLDMLGLNLARPSPRLPMLVLGSTADRIFSADDVRRTARAWNADWQLFDGIGHDVMLETRWQEVADRIADWLTERGLDTP